MFILNGTPLALDRAFTTPDGTQYPASFLRLSSPQEREAIGITEVPDEIPYNQQYYWGYDTDGNLIPKQLEDEVVTPEEGESYTQTGLKTQHIRQTKETANTLLQPTDWYVIRQMERNIEIPEDIASYRAEVLAVSDAREELISAVTTVEELKSLYESSSEINEDDEVVSVPPAMPNWPNINN
jgi:hypothetical protein